MTARRPDIAEALHRVREAADQDPARPPQGGRDPSGPAGDPEAPATPPTTPAEDKAEDTDHERQLEHDLEELAAKAEKADEYLELAQRTRADFENYRRRATREAAAAQERGIAKLAKELLPAVDNLDRALEAAAAANAGASTGGSPQDNGTATLVSGIKLVHEDVIAALARAGIERFSPEGRAVRSPAPRGRRSAARRGRRVGDRRRGVPARLPPRRGRDPARSRCRRGVTELRRDKG